MSKAVGLLPAGTVNAVYRSGSSLGVVTGKDGATYWFLFERLPQRVHVPNIPRYTESDAINTAEKYLDAQITETVKFRDVWETRISAVKVALEENVFKKWYHRRLVILG